MEIPALSALRAATADSEVIALPGLHAKVYIADDAHAIVTSANLTRAGLDTNYEYGVGLSDTEVVNRIHDDMESYAELGRTLDDQLLKELTALGAELKRQAGLIEQATPLRLRQEFDQRMRAAEQRLAEVHVGARTANELFGRAIMFALRDGPRTTKELAGEVQLLLPDLCDDSEELVINGERYGKAWKHRLRNAQQHLKRRGLVVLDANSRQWLSVSTRPA